MIKVIDFKKTTTGPYTFERVLSNGQIDASVDGYSWVVLKLGCCKHEPRTMTYSGPHEEETAYFMVCKNCGAKLKAKYEAGK